MSDGQRPKDFDPYGEWLGVPPGPRPPSPEVLLGLPAGETDQERILEAAMRQKERLDGLMLSEHGALAARLTKEVAGAMLSLLERTAAIVGKPVPSPGGDAEVDEVTALVADLLRPLDEPSRAEPIAGVPIDQGAGPANAPGRASPEDDMATGPADHETAPSPEASPTHGTTHTLENLERAVAMLGRLAAPDAPVLVRSMARLAEKEELAAQEKNRKNWVAEVVEDVLRVDAVLKQRIGQEYDILFNFFRVMVVASVCGVLILCVWCIGSVVVRGVAAFCEGISAEEAVSPDSSAPRDKPPKGAGLVEQVPPEPPSPPAIEQETEPPRAVAPFEDEAMWEHLRSVASTVEAGKTWTFRQAVQSLGSAPLEPVSVTGWSASVRSSNGSFLLKVGPHPANVPSPDGTVYDGVMNEFRWTPSEKQAPGTYDVTLTFDALDGRSIKRYRCVTVTKPAEGTAPDPGTSGMSAPGARFAVKAPSTWRKRG